MNYPLNLSFKLLALASQISVTDAGGRMIGFAKQKLLKLKEDVRIFADTSQTDEIYQIKADRMIDFSARYSFFDSRTGQQLGAVKRRGMRSLWSAHYEILDNDQVVMEIKEENAWVKVLDTLVGEIPIFGAFTGYFLNPVYLVSRTNGTLVARLQKHPAMFEGKFELTQQGQMSEAEEIGVLLSVLQMVILERARG
jgi:hypothetical protein